MVNFLYLSKSSVADMRSVAQSTTEGAPFCNLVYQSSDILHQLFLIGHAQRDANCTDKGQDEFRCVWQRAAPWTP